ncbi:MAG: glutamate-1-semialdehyde 2,1-aminomutase, partial [Faecalibacillus sp.]
MNSNELFEKACKFIPGGVNSPVRAFRNVDMVPVFIDHGKNSKVYDVEGNEYIDYIGSWGPLILGHSHDVLIKEIQSSFVKGTSFGLPTEKEITLAQLMCEAYPGMDKVRMVNSGTEATMSAIRVARGFTKRDKIIKFEGNYHGHSDCLLVQAGSGALTFQEPTSPGVPDDLIKNTLVCRYNDLDDVKNTISKNKNQIACIILEPIACNMGLVEGNKDFIAGLRKVCDEERIILIFDEVISGFRIGFHSAADYFGVIPDMACFGKIIGGGLPVGAYG